MQPQQDMRLGDEQLREKFGGRQIAVPVVEIHPLRRHDAEVRRPDLVEALHQRKTCRLLGITLHRDKAGVDRVDHLGIRVRHGTQALAAASGRREEIQQHEFMVLACLVTGRIKIVSPLDRSHVSILPLTYAYIRRHNISTLAARISKWLSRLQICSVRISCGLT